MHAPKLGTYMQASRERLFRSCRIELNSSHLMISTRGGKALQCISKKPGSKISFRERLVGPLLLQVDSRLCVLHTAVVQHTDRLGYPNSKAPKQQVELKKSKTSVDCW